MSEANYLGDRPDFYRRGVEPSDIASLIDLSGQKALVTGAAKGIGAAIAVRLSQAGADVTIADLDPAGAAVAESIGGSFVRCDITDATELSNAVATAAGTEPLSIMINNAGVFPTTGPVSGVRDDFVSHMLDVNVRAQFSATREAAQRMTAGGAIVNMASIAGLRGGANISAYAASKAAVVAMTRAHAHELGPKGIRVNAIAPGVIETPGVEEQLEPLRASGFDIAARIAANPVGVAGQPDHIARGALFLVSELAVFVTGHVLVIDGGATA